MAFNQHLSQELERIEDQSLNIKEKFTYPIESKILQIYALIGQNIYNLPFVTSIQDF